MSADIEAHGHIGSCPRYALFASHGKATKPRKDEFRKGVGTIIERTLTGGARMDTYKDRIDETERVKERKRARVEQGAVDVPEDPGIEMMSRWRFDMQTHLAVYNIENQHEENRMRDIQVSKRGSEAASEEQSDELRKTVRFEQDAPNASASSDPHVALGYPASGETQSRPRSVLVQKSSHVDDDVQISALDAFYEDVDERVVTSEKCWSGIEEKMPEIPREVN